MAAAASAAGPSTSCAPSSAPASANSVRSFSGRSGASRYAATAVSNAGPTGALHEPGLRLGVVRHGVAGQQPERGGAAGVGGRDQTGVSAGVRRHGEAVPVAARLEGERGLTLLQQRRHGADVRLGGQTHERTGDGLRRRAPRPARPPAPRSP